MAQYDLESPEYDDDEQRNEHEATYEAFATTLCRKFNEYASKRLDKEREWRNAIEQYNGEWDSTDAEKLQQALGGEDISTAPNINITRPKCDTAIAKLEDIQFPVGGDYNFTMKASAVSQAIRAALQDDKPDIGLQADYAAAGEDPEKAPSPKQVAQAKLKNFIEATRRMSNQIREDLVATNYGLKARLALFDFIVYGTGIIKGPFPEYVSSLTYDDMNMPVVSQEITASSSRVDPRFFYPDPSARLPEEVDDAFEVHFMNTKDMIKLADSPAFMKEQIAKVLKAGGSNDDLPPVVRDTSFRDNGVDMKNKFVVHEYHGPLPKQVLYDGGLISEDTLEDPTQEIYGQAWFCDRTLIRLSLPLIEGYTHLPYHIAPYKRDPNNIFGHGLPYLLRHIQRIMNKTYLMLMDNAALTSMPQIVMNKEMIEPAGRTEDYTLAPGKVWHLTEYGVSVNDAMQFIDIPANSQGLTQIMDMCMQFADIESTIPIAGSSEAPMANNLAGLAAVLTAMSIVQKNASLSWDDNITEPLIQGYYHYNMQFNDDESIKGNMKVEIGGATARIDAQMRAQDIERILGLAQLSPEYQVQVDPIKGFRELVANSRAGDILRTVEEVESMMEEQAIQAQKEQSAPDPAALKAQVDQGRLELAKAEFEFSREKFQAELQANERKEQRDEQVKMLEIEARNTSAYVALQELEGERELALMKMAHDREVSVEDQATRLQVAKTGADASREKVLADLVKFREEVQVKKEQGSGI